MWCCLCDPVFSRLVELRLVTDRQTDRQTQGHGLYCGCIASRGKNGELCRNHIHTRTCPLNGPLSGTTQVSQYQKGKTNLDFTEARDSEWQWHQLGHMQVCTSLQTDNHTSTPPLLQARCPSCRPTNSITALKAINVI